MLVDGVDGEVIQHFVEDNPEDWSELDTGDRSELDTTRDTGDRSDAAGDRSDGAGEQSDRDG